MMQFRATDRNDEPTPHIATSEVFAPEFYAALERDFPEEREFPVPGDNGWYRMSRDLIRGDAAYAALMRRRAPWQTLYEYVYSDQFITYALSLFGDTLRTYGSRVRADRAYFSDHDESREWMSTTDVATEVRRRAGDPNALFSRLDIGLGLVGYKKEVHRDWPHRLFSMLIYFSDADEEHMEGGTLHLGRVRGQSFEPVVSLRPKKNSGIIMLDTPTSHHCVDELTRTDRPRKSLYIAVSSTVDIWHGAPLRALSNRVRRCFLTQP